MVFHQSIGMKKKNVKNSFKVGNEKMTSIPQCMHCKNRKIENEIIICKKYQVIPEKIANGIDTCKYHENIKNKGGKR